ncbi:MAG: type I restriction enzyme HsdR N-terminal domain-containing protein [Bacteroides sp.]|nr:type I restriction enzyme HsdR N-terminal domain-containing protein [Bacteroides sp.]
MKNEKLTRKEIIDRRLQEAGWHVNDYTQVIEEFFVSTGSHILSDPPPPYGNQICDYVLLGKNGKPLAVVEAKKTTVDPRVGEEQAKQYAGYIQEQYQCELPFCLYTNGNEIYFWDLGNYAPPKDICFPYTCRSGKDGIYPETQKALSRRVDQYRYCRQTLPDTSHPGSV